jgi:hypothetical protein
MQTAARMFEHESVIVTMLRMAARSFGLGLAVSLKECGVNGSPRLFVDNSAEAAHD